MKRLLDCNTSDLKSMNKQEKLMAIRASEGRVMMQEISLFGGTQLLEPLTDSELACAFGADLLLLNAFDVEHPSIPGIDAKPEDVIKTLKHYTGRLIGLNLEPVDKESVPGHCCSIPEGRIANARTAKIAADLGFDFILLTGNPSTGVTNKKIIQILSEIDKVVGNEIILMAGKMHAAGITSEAGSQIVSREDIRQFVESGADVCLLPAPGTVPGIRLEFVSEMAEYIHECGALSLTAIGTSQEGADKNTIREIALMCKMAGTDLHHIGDAALGGMDPENLMEYSIAIRGKRHTYIRMARSINR